MNPIPHSRFPHATHRLPFRAPRRLPFTLPRRTSLSPKPEGPASCKPSSLLTLSALLLACLLPGLALAGIPESPGSGGPRYGQFGDPVSFPGQSSRQLVATATVDQVLTISSDDGAVDVFNPGQARDVLASFVNRGPGQVRVEVQRGTAAPPDFETLLPGRPIAREFGRVSDLLLTCISSGTRAETCQVEMNLITAKPSGSDADHMSLDLWYNGPAVAGSADVEPDSWPDCLWNQDTLWTSGASRDIQVNVQITGQQDVSVEIEYANHTFSSYNLQAPPAMAQFGFLQEYFDDAIAVRVHCSKGVNACGNCQYDYSVTVIP